ncbi:MAG: ferritin-like domain-containing protein [Armatimonadota bacterium]|nr:ferritin-like domain-containing protein [Armatimonadota bacterium]MDR7438565.1 ferritin-like domain-containing protein [Armatimonadota bacterium]MDR7567089.1 ferritin-like domain-containing protein [Armatimonadota bacterium]MDR7602730.1 ferritin-like domain-containing protein [Armatimonadota bacterium]
MGQKGRAIVELDVDQLVQELKKAYLDELLAFYSYWITAQVAEGWHGEELVEHFEQEAREELEHAKKLALRIVELGGDPVVPPKDWEAGANAPWTAPRTDWADADGMVEDQIRAERQAIEVYNRLAKLTFGKDPVTYQLATELLTDEVRHEEFLEALVARRRRV